MKRIILMIFLVLCGCILGACSSESTQDLQEYQTEFYSMDTVINVQIYADDEELAHSVLQGVENEYARIDKLSNRYDEGSDVYKLNHALGESVVVIDDVFAMVEASLTMGEKSRGAFDVALGEVSDLWDFMGDPHVPSDVDLTSALLNANNENIIVDKEAKTIAVKNGAVIDLGAVAKGYATDCAVAVLREAGIDHAIINAGGNVYALGSNPEGEPWRIGIRNPRPEEGSELVGVIEASDKAVVTSGDDQRYFIKDGDRYHHILDPVTGYPATECIFTTIICDNSMDADMLSTAVFVLGPDEYQSLLDQYDSSLAVMMDSQKNISASPGMEQYLTLVD